MKVLASDGSSAHLLGDLMSPYAVAYEVARCTAAVVQREVAKTRKLFLDVTRFGVPARCRIENVVNSVYWADFCHSFRRYRTVQLPLHNSQTSPLLLRGNLDTGSYSDKDIGPRLDQTKQ